MSANTQHIKDANMLEGKRKQWNNREKMRVKHVKKFGHK
jgi:hypothetical protein